jgi:hypothetical protein
VPQETDVFFSSFDDDKSKRKRCKDTVETKEWKDIKSNGLPMYFYFPEEEQIC